MVFPDTTYYLSRAGRTHGPLTASELEAFMAYGSVKPDDLLRTEESSDWITVGQWQLSIQQPEEPDVEDSVELPAWKRWLARLTQSKAQRQQPRAPRRRTVRFREWKYVPEEQRSTLVISDLLLGFVFFPPRLWSACSRVFSHHIFRKAVDDAGYLKIWPRWMESVCTTLLFANAVYWIVLVVEFRTHALPFLKEAMGLISEGVRDWSNGIGH